MLFICYFNFDFDFSNDMHKRSKLSKLDLWLKDNSYFESSTAPSSNISAKLGQQHAQNDQANITFTLLEDSLLPLKCSLNSLCVFNR
jgi:hypothetical protein